jgi:hypothetical protein
MKHLILFFIVAMIPGVALAQQAKAKAPSGSAECAVCTKKDDKGICKEYDFSNCKPDVITARYKNFKDVTKSESKQASLRKLIFADFNNGRFNTDWTISGRNGGTIILVNAKKKTTAGITCKGCCSIVVENDTVRCAKGDGCTECNMVVVSPLPKKSGSSRK